MCMDRIATQCICCGGNELTKSPAVLMPFIAKRVFGYDPVLISPDWGLRDLQCGIAYSVCNSLQCSNCGVLFLDMRFTDREMASLYAGYRDEEYTQLRDHFEPGYRKVNESFSDRGNYISVIENFLRPRIPPTPALLDWGGDTGVNTPLKKEARTVHVYDISKKPVMAGVQSVDLQAIRRSKYDVIVCSQVLEHVPYPQDILKEIVSVMDMETILYLEVPYEELMRVNPGATDIVSSKHHWHEHINFFSEKSLVVLLKVVGLQLVEMQAIPISLGWRDACVIAMLCKRA